MNLNDLGLRLLSFVKKVKGNEVEINQIGKSETPSVDHNIWNDLVSKFVNDKGQVN